MSEPKVLQTRSYSETVRDFARQNFNLKILCAVQAGLLFLMLVLVLFLVKKGPEVIALNGDGEVASLETKVTDLQIQAAVRRYLSFRYNWTQDDIASRLKNAEFFVASALVGSFRKSMIDVQKFVVEKKVSQRLYPRTVSIDLKERRARITADRITEFGGLKAATEMNLTLSFEIDSRSIVNPWGVFIVKESEGGEK